MTLYYETHGKGAAVLLIPGFASGTWNWFRQTELLSDEFMVVTFDPRGIGHSLVTGDDKALSMTTFTDDVAGVLDKLGLASAHIVGASFGGFVAQSFALAHPDRVDKLVLACTSAGGSAHVKPSDEVLRAFVPDPTMSLGERVRKFMRPAFSDEFAESDPDIIEDVCAMRENHEVSDAVYMAQLQAAFMFDSNAKLGAITSPTLVISGDSDRVVPKENSVNLASKIPNSRLEIVERGSHMLFIENAGEFNRRVREFLK